VSAVTDRLTRENVAALAAILARVRQRIAAGGQAADAPPPDGGHGAAPEGDHDDAA
jgi:hypothetical protein